MVMRVEAGIAIRMIGIILYLKMSVLSTSLMVIVVRKVLAEIFPAVS